MKTVQSASSRALTGMEEDQAFTLTDFVLPLKKMDIQEAYDFFYIKMPGASNDELLCTLYESDFYFI